MQKNGFRFSLDIGGTFTDLFLASDLTGETLSFKSSTTPYDLSEGVMNVVSLTADNLGLQVSDFLSRTATIVHGTTATTNALIENRVDKIGMLTTRGFRDILFAREGGKEKPFHWKLNYPDSFVPRYLILPVTERINSEGEIEVPLDEYEVKSAIASFKKWNVRAIAVCFLWSIVNPIHEERVGQIISEEWPGLAYDLSYRTNPIIREYRRFISTAINSSLHGIIDRYVVTLESKLKENGFRGNLLFTNSTGGVTGVKEIIDRPILTVGSGPSVLPVSSLHIGQLEKRATNVIGLDMGGTSLDIAFVRNGRIILTREASLKPTEEGGDKLGLATVDVESVGAGGGSIAWRDSANYMHVGPRSAGGYPGPACYDQGGTEPTVTDANLVLGYLNPDYFLGGQKKLSVKNGENAIRKISGGADVTETASRIYTTVTYDMFLSLRDLTAKRGIDPKDMCVVCGGGAFALHAATVAEEVGIPQIIVPKEAATLSAYGGLLTDIRLDFSSVHYTRSDTFDAPGVVRILKRLETQGYEFLSSMNVDIASQELRYSVEARYPYQVYELEVPVEFSEGKLGDLRGLISKFHSIHQAYYSVMDQSSPVEFVSWRVTAIGKVNKPKIVEAPYSGEDSLKGLKGRRKIFLLNRRETDAPIYDGNSLQHGNIVEGPALIEEVATTILVPYGWKSIVSKYRNYILQKVPSS
jgi:N-methylhydantoinase A